MATKAKAVFNEVPMTRASRADPRLDHEISYLPLSPDTQAGIGRPIEAGIGDGNVVKALFSAPGFSLMYAWFNPSFAEGPLMSPEVKRANHPHAGVRKMETVRRAIGKLSLIWNAA
jgi:hypothetical protein